MGNFLSCICCKSIERDEIDENLYKAVSGLLYQQDTPTYENDSSFRYRKNLIDERFQHTVEIARHILRADNDTPIMMFFDGYQYQPIEMDIDNHPIAQEKW